MSGDYPGHDREPFTGNPPTQKTARQGHNDVPFCTCHGSYTSPSTSPAIGCYIKRPPLQVQRHILQDQGILRIPLPIKYQTVKPTARKQPTNVYNNRICMQLVTWSTLKIPISYTLRLKTEVVAKCKWFNWNALWIN